MKSEISVLGVVLAAGASSRMGTSKMALKWGESTVLETTLRNASLSSVTDILLVTGGYLELIECLPGVRTQSQVHNSNYATGEMISSIKLALNWIESRDFQPDGVFVLPGDMPLISDEMIDQLIDRWQASPTMIVAPIYDQKRGHPVLFPYEIFQQFKTLPAESVPRDLLKRFQDRMIFVEIADPAVLIDIDTPEAYKEHRLR
ncbi:MAG: nucleotidyltransferase family protein [Chloroflexota bacterium]